MSRSTNKEPIQKAVVDAVWRQAATASPKEAHTWMEDLMLRQPELDHYLFTADEHYAPSDSRGLIFLTGFLIWHVIAHEAKVRRQVTRKDLEAAQKANQDWIYELEAGASLTRSDLLEKLGESCRQKALWKTVLATLMEESSIANDLKDANRRLALLHVKTVLDCLDRQVADADHKAESGRAA